MKMKIGKLFDRLRSNIRACRFGGGTRMVQTVKINAAYLFIKCCTKSFRNNGCTNISQSKWQHACPSFSQYGQNIEKKWLFLVKLGNRKEQRSVSVVHGVLIANKNGFDTVNNQICPIRPLQVEYLKSTGSAMAACTPPRPPSVTFVPQIPVVLSVRRVVCKSL